MTNRNPEKGAIYQVQKKLFFVGNRLDGMLKRTETALDRVDQLDKKANEIKEKASVKKELKQIRNGQNNAPSADAPNAMQKTDLGR